VDEAFGVQRSAFGGVVKSKTTLKTLIRKDGSRTVSVCSAFKEAKRDASPTDVLTVPPNAERRTLNAQRTGTSFPAWLDRYIASSISMS